MTVKSSKAYTLRPLEKIDVGPLTILDHYWSDISDPKFMRSFQKWQRSQKAQQKVSK